MNLDRVVNQYFIFIYGVILFIINGKNINLSPIILSLYLWSSYIIIKKGKEICIFKIHAWSDKYMDLVLDNIMISNVIRVCLSIRLSIYCNVSPVGFVILKIFLFTLYLIHFKDSKCKDIFFNSYFLTF